MKKGGDWEAAVGHLESYLDYADEWGQYCVDLVNQEPPSLTDSNTKLLERARAND